MVECCCSSVLRVFGVLLYLSLLRCVKACLSLDVIVGRRLLSCSLLAASLNSLCSGVSVLLLNRYNSLLLLSLSSLSILQNITDSINLHTESYLNCLPLRLTTVTDCTRCHLLVNPTIPYHVCVNNKRLYYPHSITCAVYFSWHEPPYDHIWSISNLCRLFLIA